MFPIEMDRSCYDCGKDTSEQEYIFECERCGDILCESCYSRLGGLCEDCQYSLDEESMDSDEEYEDEK